MGNATNELDPRPMVMSQEFLEAHQADMKRRQEERDKRCPPEERLRLCDGVYAGMRELEKPDYKWTVEATIHEHKPKEKRDRFDFSDEDEPGSKFVPRVVKGIVIGKTESDAWAKFCDHIKMWPSRRTAKPEIVRGEEVNPLLQAAKAIGPPYREKSGM